MATIGLSKPYYAIYSNDGNAVTYSNGGLIGKGTQLTLELEEGDSNNFYADNAVAETDNSFPAALSPCPRMICFPLPCWRSSASSRRPWTWMV